MKFIAVNIPDDVHTLLKERCTDSSISNFIRELVYNELGVSDLPYKKNGGELSVREKTIRKHGRVATDLCSSKGGSTTNKDIRERLIIIQAYMPFKIGAFTCISNELNISETQAGQLCKLYFPKEYNEYKNK